MSDPNIELQNPNLPAEKLAEIANGNPQLWDQILAHPNIQPELRDWITQHQSSAQSQPGYGAGDPGQQNQQNYNTDRSNHQGYGGDQPGQQNYGAGESSSQSYGGGKPEQQGNGAGQANQPGYGAGKPSQPAYGADNSQPAKKKSKGPLIAIISALVVVALLIGVGVTFLLGGFSRGSGKPEDAAQKFVSGAISLNNGDIYSSLAPSEFKPFEEAVKKLSEASLGRSGMSFDDLSKEISSNVKVTTEDLKSETTTIVPDSVTRVTYKSGKIRIKADKAKLKETLQKFYSNSASPYMQFADDAGKIVDSFFPDNSGETVIDVSKFSESVKIYGLDQKMPSKPKATELTFISVKEPDGKWYVSPLMTIAEAVYVQNGGDLNKLGTSIVPAAKNSSPEQAIEGFMKAYSDNQGSWKEYVHKLAAQMPLAERRMLSIYIAELQNTDNQLLGLYFYRGFNYDVKSQKYSAEKNGAKARVKINELILESRDGNRSGSNNQRNRSKVETERIEIRGTCIQFQSGRTQQQKYCLEEIPSAKQLDLHKIALIAVEEDGNWHMSLIGTVADIYATIVPRLIELSRNGTI
ncbi:MAG: hypothetical protein Q4C71_02120 [Microbacteriaceae bacterium]|nr:hypothetical protein [Microbacteriaceae bacterium]